MLSKSTRIATVLGGLTSLASLAGLAVLTGCPTRDISQLDTHPAIEVKKTIEVHTNRQVDILFVIDDSTSMAPKQTSLVTHFKQFTDVLQTIQGGLPDVHIGVVSSDVGIGAKFTGEQCHPGGDHGLLQNTAHPQPDAGACPVPNGGARFISDVAAPGDGGVRIQNYNGDLAATFACIAFLGTPGCGFEHHLESMKQALDGTNPENAGFLRPDAFLAVVVLGDEDDCSASNTSVFDSSAQEDNVNSVYGPFASFRCTEFGIVCNSPPPPLSEHIPQNYTGCVPDSQSPYLYHPQHYYDFLRTLKPNDPSLLIGAVIAGNPTPVGTHLDTMGRIVLNPSCSYISSADPTTPLTADPAVRLKYFADQFQDHGTFVSICQDDLSDALTTIAQLLAKVISTPCLDSTVSPVDLDPASPGLQIDCQVSDITAINTPEATEVVVPRCEMVNDTTPDPTGERPCWWADIDPKSCPSGVTSTNLALHVERNTDTTNVTEVARCVQAADSSGPVVLDAPITTVVDASVVTPDARLADARPADARLPDAP